MNERTIQHMLDKHGAQVNPNALPSSARVELDSRLLLLCGPPGAGKHVLARALCARRPDLLAVCPQLSTRSPRSSDPHDGQECIAVDPIRMAEGRARGSYLYFRDSGKVQYAVDAETLLKTGQGARVLILVNHSWGTIALKTVFPRAVALTLRVSEAELIRRLRAREWSPGDIEKALANASLDGATLSACQAHFNDISGQRCWYELDNSRNRPPICEETVEQAWKIARSRLGRDGSKEIA